MKKILVADDEMSIRLFYSEELKEEGYEVYLAANGREALEIVEKIPLDLVILDIKMPEMDGIEALRRIKSEMRPDLPVILSTSYTEYKQDFAIWASDEYLVKSCDLEDLKAVVKRYLGEGILSSYEDRIREKINDDVTILINNEKESNWSKSYNARITDYEKEGFFKVFNKEEIDKLFSAKKKTFKLELLKARKIIKEYLLSQPQRPRDGLKSLFSKLLTGSPLSQDLLSGLFNKEKWLVLTYEKFEKEANELNEAFLMESKWLLEQLNKISNLIHKTEYASVPFEQFKNVLLLHDSAKADDQRLISVVMADIRHDLRNLITRIKLKYDLEEINALESILKRLYSIPFLEVKVSFSLVDIKEFMKGIVEEVSINKPEDISIQVTCDDFQTLTDPNLLGVALRQVLQNSFEAMSSQGHIELVVTPTYGQQADQQTINFHIADTGCGIPPEVLAKIFDPQFSYNKQNSSGMGLTLAKLAASALGGTIQVSSEVGKGTDVDITIPLVTV